MDDFVGESDLAWKRYDQKVAGATRATLRTRAIDADFAFQARFKMNEKNVKRLVSKLKSGRPIDPVLVGKIRGRNAPVLLDGFHRLEAHKYLQLGQIDVLVVETTLAEAKWMAAEANARHGLQLDFSEIRKHLAAYLKAGLHMTTHKGKPKGKSLRDIAADIGVSKDAVATWIKRDHQWAEEQLGWAGGRKETPEETDEPHEGSLGAVAAELFAKAVDLFELAKRVTPEDAGRLADQLEALAVALRNPQVAEINDF